jgi:hypothetical protein
VSKHRVHFLKVFLFLAGPEGLNKKTSKFGLDYRFRKNKGDEIASMSRRISLLV